MRRFEASAAIIRSAIGTRDGANSISLGHHKAACPSDPSVQAVKEALLATEGRLRREISALRQELASERRRNRSVFPVDSGTGSEGSSRLLSPFSPTAHALNLANSGCSSDGVAIQRPANPFSVSTAHSVQSAEAALASGGLQRQNSPKDEAEATGPPAFSPVTKPESWYEWPQNLKIRREVLADDSSQHVATLRSLAEYHHHQKRSETANFADVETDPRGSRRCTCGITRPDSLPRLSFDLLGMLVLTFQLTYTPFALAWPAAVEQIDPAILAANVLFWGADMCFNFVTGYYTKAGEVEMRFYVIARRYIKTWFIFDAACLVADIVNAFPVLFDVYIIPDDAGPASRGIRMLKLHRFARVFLMMRMLRMAPEISTLLQIHFSTTVYMLIQITALLLWLSHIVACGWYSLGRWANPGTVGARWVDLWHPIPFTISPSGEEILGKGPEDVGTTYQYATSYHWALAQITLGAHDVNPVNSSERLVAILCNLFGLLFAGTLVSILSAAMIEVREVDWVRATSLRKLRHFLLQHDVALDVRMQVLRQVQDRLRPQERTLAEKDVAALTVLSKTLLRQLRYVLYYEHLRDHPLLQVWGVLAEASVKHLCREGINFEVLPHDDELFATGVVSWATHYLVKGKVMYVQAPSQGLVTETVTEVVTQGAWLSEATWWCHWQHVGSASCISSCTFIAVPPASIAAVMKFDLAVRTVTIEYGTRFFQHVISRTDGFVTDVEAKDVGVKGLLCFLPQDVHVLLGMSALQQVMEKREHRRRLGKLLGSGYMDRLQHEVLNGNSLVLLNREGVLHRQVALTVAQIENDAGELLVELLSTTSSTQTQTLAWKPAVALPAIKQRSDEEPRDSLQRLLRSQLLALAGCFDNAQVEFESDMRDSQRFGIATNYIKTCFKVRSTEAVTEILQHHAIAPYSRTLTASVVCAAAWRPIRLRLMRMWRKVDEVFHLQGEEGSGIYAWMSREDMKILADNKAILLDLLKLDLQPDGNVKYLNSQLQPPLSSLTNCPMSGGYVRGSSRLEPCDEDEQGDAEDTDRKAPDLQVQDWDMEKGKQEEGSEDEDIDQI